MGIIEEKHWMDTAEIAFLNNIVMNWWGMNNNNNNNNNIGIVLEDFYLNLFTLLCSVDQETCWKISKISI